VAANATPPPLVLENPHDSPEQYEFVRGQWRKKESVGRGDHSDIEFVVLSLLRPIAQRLGARVKQEWTVAYGTEKIIPDVTFSFPNPEIRDGYLVAPAFLAVESRSSGQRLKRLVDKCRLDHHRMGTPYCWILDTGEEAAYECHKEMSGMHRLVETLTAGPEIRLSADEIFAQFRGLK
jgi:Uma2 family endonuclease